GVFVRHDVYLPGRKRKAWRRARPPGKAVAPQPLLELKSGCVEHAAEETGFGDRLEDGERHLVDDFVPELQLQRTDLLALFQRCNERVGALGDRLDLWGLTTWHGDPHGTWRTQR